MNPQAILQKGSASVAPFTLRLMLAGVLFPHGAQKLLGIFGGFGFSGSMSYFTGTVGLPWIVGFAVIIIEFFGSLSLLFGLATRFWSTAILCVMAGIVITEMHGYFFMNWFGNQKTEGAEFFLLAIGMALSLLVTSAGRWSVDAWLAQRRRKKISPAGEQSIAQARRA